MKYWIGSWKKCMVFSGRSPRKEFWNVFLCNLVLGLSVAFWFFIFNIHHPKAAMEMASVSFGLWSLATLLPVLSSIVRRLHDIGKCGLYAVLPVIPVIGLIVLLAWLCKKGDDGENVYGLPFELKVK